MAPALRDLPRRCSRRRRSGLGRAPRAGVGAGQCQASPPAVGRRGHPRARRARRHARPRRVGPLPASRGSGPGQPRALSRAGRPRGDRVGRRIPRLSLLFATEAARIDLSPRNESVLVRALWASRVRGTTNTPGQVESIEIPSRRVVVAELEDKLYVTQPALEQAKLLPSGRSRAGRVQGCAAGLGCPRPRASRRLHRSGAPAPAPARNGGASA